MVREKKIAILLNDEEYDELKNRASDAHLSLAAYCRTYLFNSSNIYSKMRSISQYDPLIEYEKHQYTIPYMASKETIERIKAGKEPYVDPYQQARLDAKNNFAKSGGLGELNTTLKIVAAGGRKRVLKSIPKKDIKELEKSREERKLEVNKTIKELEMKGIKV